MDDSEHQCCQEGDASVLAETSSCASSITLIEPITSTLNLPSDSEKHCPFLVHLPKHLLFNITAHLDVVSRICLQSVNRRFRNVIDVDFANLEPCARWTLARRGGGVSKIVLPSACALCKSSKCMRFFNDVLTHLEQPQHGTTKWIMRLLDRSPWARRQIALEMEKKQKPNYYACAMRRLTPDPAVEALMPFVIAPLILPTWIRFAVLRCFHCGRCISEGDTRLMGCRDCNCDYCPRRPDHHFRRCGLGQSDRIRPKLVKKNLINGGIDVVECFWKFRITSPVIAPVCRADGKRLDRKHIYYVNEDRNVRPEHIKRGEICYQQSRLGEGDPWSSEEVYICRARTQADVALHLAAVPIGQAGSNVSSSSIRYGARFW